MNKVMIPFDGSDASGRALQFVIEQLQGQHAREVHVLNAQPVPGGYREDTTAAADQCAIRAAQFALGRRTLEPAERALMDSGIPFQSHIHFGNIRDVVVDQASRLGCTQIVMGNGGSRPLRGLILGSVASRVVRLAKIPVTLVK